MCFITNAMNNHSAILFQLKTKIFETQIPVIQLLTQDFQNPKEVKELEHVTFIAWDPVRMNDYLKGM